MTAKLRLDLVDGIVYTEWHMPDGSEPKIEMRKGHGGK